MIVFPCAKINLGLNIVGCREDGYHNLETVYYPIPLYDALEVQQMDTKFPSEVDCDLKITGNAVDCNEQDNLVVRAYQLIAVDYELPRVHAHLYKHIPSQAGLGGGSSDAAFMIRLLDEHFQLDIGYAEMERYAARLGADCAFFITAQPSFATGIGDQLEPADNESGNLRGYYIGIVKPDVAVSTKEAYQNVRVEKPAKCCRDIVRQPIETWKNELRNDFEESVFKIHPELGDIKQRLYDLGAIYAQMSGSGSAIFGIFKENPLKLRKQFSDCFTFSGRLE
ncbi:MAG: 4-(cytidine 5'-diphospho)-2-C-methyl-D-erythritol kinase [Prevotella sp.]|jgi:4-diphosphocytidyl-2-C-methyl-D-erythritol kinase